MKVLIIASHSGGHILPAIAFCQGLKDKDKDIEVNFATTDGKIEHKLFDGNFKATYFRKKKITFFTSFNLVVLFLEARKIIKVLKPNLIVGFGGYLSIPFIIIAYLKKIPNFIHEQNVKLGLANKVLLNFSNKVVFNFPNSQINNRFKNKALFLGMLIRKEIARIDKKQAREFFSLDQDSFTILVIGGSQGSHKINSVILEALSGKEFTPHPERHGCEAVDEWRSGGIPPHGRNPENKGVPRNSEGISGIKSPQSFRLQGTTGVNLWGSTNIQVIHIAGEFEYQRVMDGYSSLGIRHKVFPFIERMDYAFSACDFVICRAGAGTLAEILSLKVPAILVPYPGARQHQLVNAQFLFDNNAAILIENRFLNKEIIKDKILDLMNNPDKLNKLSSCLEDINNIGNARDKMAELAFKLAGQYSLN